MPRSAIGLFRAIALRVVDRVLGAVVASDPARSAPRLPEKDAREHVLDAVRELLAELEFANPGAPGTFRIPAERIFTEWPQSFLREPKLPAIGVTSFSQATTEPSWLGPPQILDATFERYGRGTALALVGALAETLVLEAWCRNDPERQSILAGLKAALRSSEARSSVLLPLPCYFDRVARLTLVGITVPDEPEAIATGRRRLLLSLSIWAPDVLLVDAGTMRPALRAVVTPASSTAP